nr:hypothetical protein Iba_scaffold39913CG0030 [Ipomoea batatas]GMD94228.1 hypothetical protein Iba_chr15aCG0430 [Ipomoea batatas]GME02397.1 hypothetical protein Iba_contig4777CG0010 [Ipomoea batatas]
MECRGCRFAGRNLDNHRYGKMCLILVGLSLLTSEI